MPMSSPRSEREIGASAANCTSDCPRRRRLCFGPDEPAGSASPFHQGRPGRHRRAGDFRICHRAGMSAPRLRWLLSDNTDHERLGTWRGCSDLAGVTRSSSAVMRSAAKRSVGKARSWALGTDPLKTSTRNVAIGIVDSRPVWTIALEKCDAEPSVRRTIGGGGIAVAGLKASRPAEAVVSLLYMFWAFCVRSRPASGRRRSIALRAGGMASA